MRMEFVKKLREKAGCENVNQFAKKLNTTAPQLYRYEQVPHADTIRLDLLCAMRKLSGLSWQELGKLIDKEFGGKK